MFLSLDSIWSFYAAVLTVCWYWICITSLIDGYFFDDPYPGYGSLEKIEMIIKKKLIVLENI